jgi:prostatic aicd phosphatase
MSFPGASGTGDVPLSTFISAFEPTAVNTTLQWCNVCNQTVDRGCGALLSAAGSSTGASPAHHDKISPVGAGFLGAGLALAVVLMVLGAAFGLGLLSFGKRRAGKTSSARGLHSEVSMFCYLFVLFMR